MKRSLWLSVLIILYLLLCAKSCDQQEEFDAVREQKRADSVKDSILSVFGSDTVASSTLAAFEEEAKIKFADFFDYRDIISDTSAAPVFREQAREMAAALFISGNSAFKGNMARPDSIWIKQPLNRVNDSIFTGELGFSPGGSFEFYAVKRNKNFGNETLKVWTVLLGGSGPKNKSLIFP
jgi:hypothetical protein